MTWGLHTEERERERDGSSTDSSHVDGFWKAKL